MSNDVQQALFAPSQHGADPATRCGVNLVKRALVLVTLLAMLVCIPVAALARNRRD